MNYIARIRDIAIAKEANKVCIGTQVNKSTEAKEANKAKEGPCESVEGDLTGHIVIWESPLFWGEMRATVLEDLGHGVRCVHPLTEMECVIPRAWLSEHRGLWNMRTGSRNGSLFNV